LAGVLSEQPYFFEATFEWLFCVQQCSKSSYFIQTVDVIAFLLYKKMYPKGAAKKYNLDVLFDRFSSLVSSAYV